MSGVTSTYYLPAGQGAAGEYDLEVTPESASWGYSSLRIVTLAAAGGHVVETGSDEMVLLPLSGSCSVEVDGSHLDLDGRANVFAGPTDFAYLPINAVATIHSERGGRFALCGSRTDQHCRSATARWPRSRSSCGVPVSPADRCATSAPRATSTRARSSPAR